MDERKYSMGNVIFLVLVKISLEKMIDYWTTGPYECGNLGR